MLDEVDIYPQSANTKSAKVSTLRNEGGLYEVQPLHVQLVNDS